MNNQANFSEFPSEIFNEIKNYVYRLIDPRNGETFYIGRGKRNRVFAHLKDELSLTEKDEMTDKLQTIREIRASGLEIIHVIHRHGLEDDQAKLVEAALIDAYPGATNKLGGDGSNEYGPMNSKEIISKYKAEEVPINHKLLFITINSSVNEREIYDACRFAWKLSYQRINRVEYVLALVKGIVRGVYKPIKWMRATSENFPEFNIDSPNRYGFIGEEARDEIKHLYLGKKVPKEFKKKGAANPIKYTFK